MPLIYRIFFMQLDELALLVINLLPETERNFLRVHLF